jgi:type IV pilus assembly protein PilF
MTQRFLGILLLFLALSQLGGCANGVRNVLPAETDQATDSDETPVRKRARLRLELAVNYFEQGQTRVALDEAKQALVQDPNYAEAHNLRGLIYLRLNDMRLAEDSFKQSLALNPRDGNVLHNYGWLMCQQGRYADADTSFGQALAITAYRDRSKTFMAQGLCELRAGKSAEAERSLARSYELDPGNPITGFNLATLLFRRGDLIRAQFYIRRLNNSELANSESLWLGIKVERRLENREAMKQLVDQLVKRYSQSKEMALFEKGSFDD